MGDTFLDKYKILENYKKDDLQEIFIGIVIDNPDEIVVINKIYKDKLSNNIMINQLQEGLFNLVEARDIDKDLLIITKYNEGIPLADFLEYFNPTVKKRISLIYEYLLRIKKYDIFDNKYKNILVDESQLVFKDNDIYFNEFILFDEHFKEGVNFSHVSKKIFELISKILPEDMYPQAPNTIVDFIKSLDSKERNYADIEEIFDKFKGIYIYDINMDSYIEKRDLPKDEESEPLNISNSREKKKTSKNTSKLIVPVIVALLMLGLIAYGFLNDEPSSLFNEQDNPIADFNVEKSRGIWIFTNTSDAFGSDNTIQKCEWEIIKDDSVISTYDSLNLEIDITKEGKYKISLRVMDKYNNWSDKTVKEINNRIVDIDELKEKIDDVERLDKLPLIVSKDANIRKDYDIYRSGSYSLKLGKEGINNRETIKISNLKFKDAPTITMWINSNTNENFKIGIKGYNNNSLVYEKYITHGPKTKGLWEIITIENIEKSLEEIEISIYDFSSPIWLDDIQISSFK